MKDKLDFSSINRTSSGNDNKSSKILNKLVIGGAALFCSLAFLTNSVAESQSENVH